jgi:hypothetical protein
MSTQRSDFHNQFLLLDNKLIEAYCARIENFKESDGGILEQKVLLHFF